MTRSHNDNSCSHNIYYLLCLGKQLRKVEEETQVDKKQQSHGNDVASILARRVAFELSDSESGSDESDTDSDWDD